jgi:hypothetical protein
MIPTPDLFGHVPPAPRRVRLDRQCDRERRCCSNGAIAIVGPGKGQHAAELRCESCGSHRGWFPREALAFITATVELYGAPLEPPILRNNSIGDHDMAKEYDNRNTGALFKNTEKDKPTDRDYSGTLDVGGVEYWMNGWVNTSKQKGTKYLRIVIKPKEDTPAAKSKAVADDLNDEIPF